MEALRRDYSLAILRLRQVDGADGVPVRVDFELRLTGDLSKCNLAPVNGIERLTDPPPEVWLDSSTQVKPVGPTFEPGNVDRVVTRFSVTTQEFGLPNDMSEADALRALARGPLDVASDAVQRAVMKLMPQFRAEDMARFARRASWLRSPRLSLPRAQTRHLAEALRLVRAKSNLWLEFGDPVGYLPLVPWEQILRPATDCPILRISPHTVKPLAAWRGLCAALVCSASSPHALPGRNELRALVGAILANLPPASSLHIFPDVLSRGPIEDAITTFGEPTDERTVTVHIPPGLADARTMERAGAPWSDYPWTAWVTRTLQGEAVDLLHILARGVFPADGMLIARDPGSDATDHLLRVVTPTEIGEFLTHAGAWGIVLSSPSGKTSHLAVRMIADRLARNQPVLSIAHDVLSDRDATALGAIYRFLRTEDSKAPADTAGTAIYCHPAWTGEIPSARTPGDPVFDAYQELESMARAVAEQPGPTPTWLAATQRIIEQTVARYVQTDASTGGDPALQRGIAETLRVLQGVITDNIAASRVSASTTTSSQEGAHNAESGH